MSKDQASVNLFFLALCILLDKDGKDSYELPIDPVEWSMPEYYHQN